MYKALINSSNNFTEVAEKSKKSSQNQSTQNAIDTLILTNTVYATTPGNPEIKDLYNEIFEDTIRYNQTNSTAEKSSLFNEIESNTEELNEMIENEIENQGGDEPKNPSHWPLILLAVVIVLLLTYLFSR